MRYPWTIQQWQQVQSRKQAGKLPHALLLAGQAGIGKRDFAIDLAQSLLCAQPDNNDKPCGSCRACVQFNAGTHPDFYLLEPEEPGKPIKVDQIRALIEELALVSHQGGYRVVVINPADAMNVAAANSLLKTLEEPPPSTLLLLVTTQPFRLPATILSRCQQVKFSSPDVKTSTEWLKSTHSVSEQAALTALAVGQNAPLAALECANTEQIPLRDELFASFRDTGSSLSAIEASKSWLKLELPGPINWVYSWIGDLIRIKSVPDARLNNEDLRADLQNLAQRVDLDGLFSLQDEVTAILRNYRAPLNAQLLMENLLLSWEGVLSR